MGTSTFSTGPGKGVPFDPEWLDDIEEPFSDPGDPDSGNDRNDEDGDDNRQELERLAMAPPRRFMNARRAIRNYFQTGDSEYFVKAVGHYSRTGMGGAGNIASRMRIPAKTAANLFVFLQSSRERTDQTISEWVSELKSRNASAVELINEIIRKVAPAGGSLDETSTRDSIGKALHDLLELEPNVDLFNLSDDNIWSIIESYLSHEAFIRLCLDIGQALEKSTISHRERVIRENQMNEYLRAEIAVQLGKLRISGRHYSSRQLEHLMRSALKNTFIVYEGAL
jgi:hypothetical protein